MEEDRSKERRQRGRGFRERMEVDEERQGAFERLDEDDEESGPAKSIEGWIVILRNVHEEAQEDDVHEACAEFGEIKNLHLNLDRKTGFVKGYALVEYGSKREAQEAVDSLDGAEILTQRISADWAFSRGPISSSRPP